MDNADDLVSEMQAAADAAVLAGATRLAVNASDAEKEQLTLDTFYANLSPALADHAGTPTVDIDFPSKKVHLAVDIQEQSILRNIQSQEFNVHVESTATVSPGTPICMIALNPHTEKALSIQGTADIKANACAVHVNSDNPRNALYQNGSGTATAQSFCVKGEHSGSNFSPPATDNCAAENDPLTTVFAADWAASLIDSTRCTYSNVPQINTSASTGTHYRTASTAVA